MARRSSSRERNIVFPSPVPLSEAISPYATISNNETRKETVEEAITLDKKTLSSWSHHPKLAVVDNVSVAGFQGELLFLSPSLFCRSPAIQPQSTAEKIRKATDAVIAFMQ